MSGIIGKTIIKLSNIDSTNNYATSRLDKENWQEGTIVHANFQENGRGQLTNLWESAPGANLLISVLFYPTFLPVSYQFLLSKVISLSVSDVAASYVDGVSIKWPNDIYIENKKVAGILIENSIMGQRINSSVAGIGLNINQTEFLSDAPNPISIFQTTHVMLDIEEVLKQLTERIDYWYALLKDKKIETIDREYLLRLYRLGVIGKYRDGDGEFIGQILGVNQIGQLVIEKVSGQMCQYHFKQVSFL
jgi:BirA family transcriptional regulator, biotin operon repressor / biotin---[acetyl-CoA-carboxylase] ligase